MLFAAIAGFLQSLLEIRGAMAARKRGTKEPG
jgi:hypothetical protein